MQHKFVAATAAEAPDGRRRLSDVLFRGLTFLLVLVVIGLIMESRVSACPADDTTIYGSFTNCLWIRFIMSMELPQLIFGTIS